MAGGEAMMTELRLGPPGAAPESEERRREKMKKRAFPAVGWPPCAPTGGGRPPATGGRRRRREDVRGLAQNEFSLIYEDKEGDWLLVGDVPWKMFTATCKRLRSMKKSEGKITATSGRV
ncbi:unnamed protein product [Spirodela intermedia]|uniref:Auxin-responsive protein n=1 Tax=Spirodela intermedia TaxID=51605 RepID=A0A7I8ITC0_SPIIN|nr:unnamed protein product [Spirodela intermedia]CAA6660854.1 unnamed protein product [Spirodela intermedia]